MVNIGIVDDNHFFHIIMEKEINKVLFSHDFEYKLYYFKSGKDFLKFAEETYFLIVFMDIDMEDLDGIETSNQLFDINHETKIIYVTSHLEKMKEAFGYNSIGFINKANLKDQLRVILNKFINLYIQDFCFRFNCTEGELVFAVSQISCFQIQQRQMLIQLSNGTCYRIKEKIMEEVLHKIDYNNFFIMANRSCLFNLLNVEKIMNKSLYLKGVEGFITISRDRKKVIEEKISNYYEVLKLW